MNTIQLANASHLESLCAKTDVAEGTQALNEHLKQMMPELEFEFVLTRGNWHRLGGVVNKDYHPISDNIVHWAETVSGGDVNALTAHYMDAGYFATIVSGKTHYFTAPVGDGPEDFIQLEIEELQEVLDRPLLDPDWFPDSLEEFLDPLDYPRLEPEKIGKPYYRFRRITVIKQLMDDSLNGSQAYRNLRRFFQDWDQSSVRDAASFCHNWVLALREYRDSEGERRFKARPVSTFTGELPELPPAETLHGAELANAIHGYDRQLGYPFAWYFMMLSSKSANYKLAESVLRDLMGAYDYLPARDLKVLRQWEERPYGV